MADLNKEARMNVLLIDDDYWHPGRVAEEGVKPLEAKGFTFDILRDGAAFAGRKLSGYPVVMFVKSDNRTAADQSKWVTEEVRDALASYVRGGGGLLAAHSGTVYGGMEDMHALLGGVFMTHPQQLPVTFKPKAGHPLAAGATAFTAMDEHYFMDMAEEPADVFLTGESRHGSLPAGWTRKEGRGRVCVLTPGHNVEVWLDPNFQKLLENALNWCAGKL
jgi:type 1 glutamine amidotransferase